MIKDFTVEVYKSLLNSLIKAGYSFQTYHDFIKHPEEKVVLLRHDVDARKEHSLQFAKIPHRDPKGQHEMGIVGTYYFRMVSELFNNTVSNLFAGMP